MNMDSLLELLNGVDKEAACEEKTRFIGPEVSIERNILNIVNEHCFVQLSNISYVRMGLVGYTVKTPMILAIIGTVICLASILWGILGHFGLVGDGLGTGFVIFFVLLGIVGIAAINFFVKKGTVKTPHYGLMLSLNSNVAYSLVSDHQHVITSAYNVIQDIMNGEAYDGPKTFNFATGNSSGGSAKPRQEARPETRPETRNEAQYDTPAKAPGYDDFDEDDEPYKPKAAPKDEYERYRPTPPPASASSTDYDPRLFVDEVRRSLDEIQYSTELSDQQRRLLIDIMMQALEGLDQGYQKDVDESRKRFREFVYKTKDTWPKLMAYLAAKPNLVKFFNKT